MRNDSAQPLPAASFVVGALACLLTPAGAAWAFPFIDSSNRDSVASIVGSGSGAPSGTDLPGSDAKGLKSQLRLLNPAPAGNPSGWTIVPRFSMQEAFTDNALEVTSPRRFDATTVFAPGISILADTSRVNLVFDYQPNLYVHAINGPLNALTQNLTMTGMVTVVPDLAFVDVRALTGVQSRLAGLSSGGSIGSIGGASAGALAPASSLSGAGAGSLGGGFNRRNQVQTSSFGISPYLLRQFGDYGTAKLGVSLDASRYATFNGFTANPFPSNGSGGQSLITTEQLARFTTGEFLGNVQAVLSANLSQSRSRVDSATGLSGGALTTLPSNSFTSQRQLYDAQLSYAMNRTFTLLGSVGAQSIRYGQSTTRPIDGITWSLGLTVTPGPDSTLTLRYGHINGADSLSANARYALSARTVVTLDYASTVGTQLEQLQNQLNNSVVNANGQLVNAQNGGIGGFQSTSALGLNSGVFRFNTLNASLNSTWLRDTIQATLSWSTQTSLSPGNTFSNQIFDPTTGQFIIIPQVSPGTGQSTDIKTISLSWTHELAPDLSFLTSASYSFIHRNGSLGNDSSLSTAVGLQYVLSDNSSVSARYSFFDRISRIPGYSLYENLVILGFTKKF